MAVIPIAELLQLPMAERMALAMALWDSLDEVGRSSAMGSGAAPVRTGMSRS